MSLPQNHDDGMFDPALIEMLTLDDEFIRHSVNLVPAKFFHKKEKQKGKVLESEEEGGTGTVDDNFHGAKRKSDSLTEKAKHKRKKFDPTNYKPVTELMREGEEEQETFTKVKEKTKKKEKKKTKENGDEACLKSSTSNLEELREKLRQRIEKLRGVRYTKLTPEQILERKRLKRKESKLKLKMKRKKDKDNTKSKGYENGEKPTKINGMIKHNKHVPAKPVFNKDGKMVFSKFDFTESGEKEKKQNKMGGKNYKKLLEKVEKSKEKLDKLKDTDADKAKKLEEKMQWTAALQRTEGIKVKDNVDMLKKAAKRKEKFKEKRKNAWKERDEKLKEKMADQQKKRQKHIQAKKQNRIDKKIKKAKKKGRLIPGF